MFTPFLLTVMTGSDYKSFTLNDSLKFKELFYSFLELFSFLIQILLHWHM